MKKELSLSTLLVCSLLVTTTHGSAEVGVGPKLPTSQAQEGLLAAVGYTDVDGDGIEELVTGSPLFDGAQTNIGRITIKGVGSSLQGITELLGQSANEMVGFKIAVLNDLNGNGSKDVAISCPGANSNRGRVDILDLKLLNQGMPAVLCQLLPSGLSTASYFGTGLSASGNLVAAGEIGGTGKVHVFQASSQGCTQLATINGMGGNGASFGQSLSFLGDVNGNGTVDLAVGAPAEDVGSQFDAGTVRVFDGNFSAAPQQIGTTLTDNVTQNSTQFGASVAAAGDANRDGWADLLVGALFENGQTGSGTAVDSGSGYLFSFVSGAWVNSNKYRFSELFAQFGVAGAAGHLSANPPAHRLAHVWGGAGSLGGAGAAQVFAADSGLGFPMADQLTGAALSGFGNSINPVADLLGIGVDGVAVLAPAQAQGSGLNPTAHLFFMPPGGVPLVNPNGVGRFLNVRQGCSGKPALGMTIPAIGLAQAPTHIPNCGQSGQPACLDIVIRLAGLLPGVEVECELGRSKPQPVELFSSSISYGCFDNVDADAAYPASHPLTYTAVADAAGAVSIDTGIDANSAVAGLAFSAQCYVTKLSNGIAIPIGEAPHTRQLLAGISQ